jgi:outer membrane immunogenic protein
MKRIAAVFFAAPFLIASHAFAADMARKAPPPAAAPAPSWTGFYVGGEVGGAWGDPNLSYVANDPAAQVLVQGNSAITGFSGQQPLFPNSFKMSGVTGGVEAGYNWQVDPKWLVGIETDFNGSSLKGTGNSTSVLESLPGFLFTQTASVQQTIDWYGTLRGRLGYLATDHLLLFGTGGLAYGRVADSGAYSVAGPIVSSYAGTSHGFSFSCTSNGAACFTGSSSQIRAGYTLGGGAEWLFARNWSVKAEYQYVNLGSAPLLLTANAVAVAGKTPSSFNANFARDDFQVVRAGLNYHF